MASMPRQKIGDHGRRGVKSSEDMDTPQRSDSGFKLGTSSMVFGDLVKERWDNVRICSPNFYFTAAIQIAFYRTMGIHGPTNRPS